MNYQAPWQRVSGNAAEFYERQFIPAMFVPRTPNLIDPAKVRPGEHILDLAHGTGVTTCLDAKPTGSAGRVVGLEINAAMLETGFPLWVCCSSV